MGNLLPKEEYAMAAVIGLESSKIEEICKGLQEQGKFVVPANYNCSVQTAISGTNEAIDIAIEKLKEAGARKVVKLDSASEENYNIVIPSHNILEFSRIIDEEDGDIELHIFNNKILFKTGNLKFESRLINGTYPNTSNLLPDDSYLVVSTNLNAFYDVIDRVSILTSDKEKNIVTLETNGDMLILKSSSVEIGRVEEKMPITKNNNEDIKISFSAKYMMEALKSFSTETVDIHFVGEIKPILIKSSEDETLTQLVLPIRTY